jgi:hypothetical protein
MREDVSSPKRRYPGFYERIVPIAIGILAVIIVVMLAYTLAVGLGILHFG